MLPEAGVDKDESQEEGGECEDRLNGGHRVEGIRDVRPNEEQLPNLEFIVLYLLISILPLKKLAKFTLNI